MERSNAENPKDPPAELEGEGRHGGLARPSNVIEAKTESSQGNHSAPFPRAIPEFFIKAFSDVGDVIFDPFAGSGTTMVAAGLLERAGFGVEISPAYCDVILRRLQETLKLTPEVDPVFWTACLSGSAALKNGEKQCREPERPTRRA